MSALLIATYAFVERQVVIYGCIISLITGVLGGTLNILVFLSLRTFRQNSCAFYLMIMSIVNVGYLLSAILPRVISLMYGSDGTENSLFYCKFRFYIVTTFTAVSLTCFCLATIDQYFVTCSRPRFRRWCNIKLAQKLVIIFIVLWALHDIPYLVLFQHIRSPTTNKISCTMTNPIYIQYRAYVIVGILVTILPITFSMIFGLMAYHNIKQLPYHAIPIVRRDLDKQLTVMVLTQVLVNGCTTIPFSILYFVQLYTNYISDTVTKAQIQLSYNVFVAVSYVYYASPFYIYMYASERFRRQLIYVLFEILPKRCKSQRRPTINQVMPQS